MKLLNAMITSVGMNGPSTVQSSPVAFTNKPSMKNKTLFSGRIEVQQVCNGYVVNITTREGYEFDTHIAVSVKEVNEIISTAMVAFQLESK